MDALDLIAKIKMDLSEYEEGLDKAKSSAEKSGSGISSAFGKVASVGGKALAGLTKVTAAAVGAAVTGVGALVKSSVDAYANYEQMVGGVKKLYGNMGMTLEQYAESQNKSVEKVRSQWENLEKAQNLVIKNAQNAYKTSGMSANQYMETATSFSAKLIKDLGGNTVKAAEVTETAMRAISDNYNTFGGDISMIQNAFQGFAKGNYMMLDNLKLGYGGTKTEMEKLIADANEYAKSIGKAGDLTIDSFADQIEAIELIQEKQQIAGTTAREATTTIEGSLGMLRAAWENLVTGIADKDADLNQLMKNVVDAIVGTTDKSGKHINGFIDNIIPVITNALESIGTLVQELVPKALEMLPTILTDVLPKLTTAATEMVQGLIDSITTNMSTVSEVLNQLIQSIVKLLPDMMKLGGELISTFASAIISNLDSILSAAGEILSMLLKGFSEHSGDIVNAAVKIITMLANFISSNIDLVVSSAVKIVLGLAQGLMDNLDVLLAAAFDICTSLAEAILNNADVIISAIPPLIQAFVDSLVEFLPQMTEAWVSLMDCIELALPEITDSIMQALPQLIDTIVNYWLGDGFKMTLMAANIMFSSLLKALGLAVAGVVASIGTHVSQMGSTIAGEAGQILESAKTLFNGLITGAKEKFANVITNISEFITRCVNVIKSKVGEFRTAGANLLTGLWNGISDKTKWVYDQITNIGGNILKKLKAALKEESPSKATREMGQYLAEGLGLGWLDSIDNVNRMIESDLDYKANIDVGTTYDDSALTATTAVKAKALTDMDVQRILGALSINLYNTTSVDGEVINQKSYKYTVERIGTETRAVRTAMGGAYV